MKNPELHIKKGDHVWVQIYNALDYAFHLRLAEVIATLHLRISCEVVPYVALRYLDNRSCACVPYEQISGICEKSP